MVWMFGRLANERSGMPSSGVSTTSTRPVSSSAASAVTASLVFGAGNDHSSTTTTLSSDARSDSAEYGASRIIFFGVRWRYERGLGPSATPPPVQWGERVEP